LRSNRGRGGAQPDPLASGERRGRFPPGGYVNIRPSEQIDLLAWGIERRSPDCEAIADEAVPSPIRLLAERGEGDSLRADM